MLVGIRLGSGIRALYELSRLPERRSAVRELAKACGVGEPFLRRILLDLRAKGYLEAQKGRVGGFTLVKDPREIKIADLAKTLEKQPTLVLGRVRRDLWAPDPSCPTYPFWANVEDKFLRDLESMTLADVIAVAKEPPPAKRTRARTTKGRKGARQPAKRKTTRTRKTRKARR